MRLVGERTAAALLATLVLVVAVLTWPREARPADPAAAVSPAQAFSTAADLYRGTYRYQGAEYYEGYGPIEEQLDVNNPPVPMPIGRRLLREAIPGLSEEMQKWPAFFRDLVLDLHFRSYYFNRDLPFRPAPPTGPDTFNQEAWALGGWLGLQS